MNKPQPTKLLPLDPQKTDFSSGPRDRVEAFIRLRQAIFAADRGQLTSLARYFDDDPPLPLQIAASTQLLINGKRDGYERFTRLLATLAPIHGARVISTSFGRPEGEAFADLGTRWAFSGTEPPKTSEPVVYFTVDASGRQLYTLPIDDPPAHGLLVHFVGYVHSGTGDHFTIRIAKDGNADETVRLGARGIALERSLEFREYPGASPRLISILVQDGWVQVFIDSILVWRHARAPGHAVKSVQFDFRPLGSHSTDAVMLGFEVWALDKPFGGDLAPDLEIGRFDVLKWHFERDHTKDVYTLLSSGAFGDLGPIVDEAIAFMKRAAAAPDGYRDWAVRSIERLLPAPARAQWERIAAQVVPQPVVEVENVTVKFHKDFARASHVMGIFKRDSETFNVLENVSFSAYPGDVIGIIGHNGAGKSTFLRTLAGLIPIDAGRIRVRDNFMLLRGGLGIRPHLSGRENVISAGIYMGLTPAQARKLIDDILEFSELGEHFDRPTKYYSDGMMSRLVFAMATSVSPEILLLDELLGAGDISFQEKAKRRMDKFIGSSKVVIVVTHGVEFVRKSCNKALVLDHGKQLYFGEPEKAVSVYLTQLNMSLGTQESGSRF